MTKMHEPRPPRIDLADLARFLVAATDGLVIQYEVIHDEQACRRQLEQVIRAGALLAGVTPEGDGQGPVTEERGLEPSGGFRGVVPPGQHGQGAVTEERGLEPSGGSGGSSPRASTARARRGTGGTAP